MKRPTRSGFRRFLAGALDCVGDALIDTSNQSGRKVKVSDLLGAELNLKPSARKR